ncbi:A-kinase anchor protein 7 isoform gamma [Plakobranchus ocellatus]|uniref:A-kinase anchor protein 7 isoform gamma n=1 Tax=Plakobranchus ocellatus TaxID=259542 RepID=A0AAV4CGG0_9GAST|nr:A-kinase anchor protein 7 isoform gamma [Plakobranchus ocellatus]
MRSQHTVSKNYKIKARNFLPLTLQNQIKAQVSVNQHRFVEQILRQGSSLFSPLFAHSQCLSAKMEQQDIEQIGCHGESCPIQTEQTAQAEDKERGFAAQDKGNPQLAQSKQSKERYKVKRRSNEMSESSNEVRPPKRISPNYFVAVQITDPQIHSVAKRIQDGILQASDVDISSTRIPPIKFHITLMVMHLEDEDAVKKAETTLEKLGPILSSKLGDREVTLEFKGLSVFGGGRVVFSPPQPSPSLDDLHMIAEEVVTQMRENGISSTDREEKQLHPHLTLFKFKNDKHLFRQERFPGEEHHEDNGHELVNREVSWGGAS